MNKINFLKVLLFTLAAVSLNSCDVIGGIFEAGIWVGVIIVVLIIVLVIWLIRKMLK